LTNLKRTLQIAAVSVAITCAVHAAPRVLNDPKDVQDIIRLENVLAKLTDVEKVIPLFAANATVADLSLPGWYVGRDNIYAAFKPQFDSIRTLEADIKNISVVTDGQLSCAALTIQLKGSLKNGTPLSTTFRELDALKKIDGQWRWIQQQVSYPMDPKTGHSLIDGPLPGRGNLRSPPSEVTAAPLPLTRSKGDIRHWFDSALLAKDVDAMSSLFVAGDDSLIFNEMSPGELRGADEVRNYYAPILANVQNIDGTPAALAVDSDGTLGALIGRVNLKVTTKDGKTQLLSIRQSDCLRQVDGKWRAFFEMTSFPVDLKTGQAVTTSAG